MSTPEERKTAATAFALQNALEHGGTANPKAVMGRLIAYDPELKKDIKTANSISASVCGEVNLLSLDEQKRLFGGTDPDIIVKKEHKEASLPDLPDADRGIVVRFAPGPSGPLHIGHTRAVILNDEYVRRYGGKYFIRLEDTNPEKVDPEAYDLIFKDLDWLGIGYTDKAIQSDRIAIYYDHVRQLIAKGDAYICDCPVESWRELKNAKKPCPHRELPPEVQLAGWEKMLDGTYLEGQASLVVKTDLSHPNPAVRDFVGMRIVEKPHPRVGSKYRVWPTYNLSVAIDDHLMGMTHVLRGKDHLNNTVRQQFVYRHMGWTEPHFTHYGWVSIEDTLLKKTLIKEAVASGEFTGWDDPRLGTLQAMANRGISPLAIRKYWVAVGIKQVDIEFSWENLYAFNRDIVGPASVRLFFVPDPVEVSVTHPADHLEVPNHPDRPELGKRSILIGPAPQKVLAPAEDLARVPEGGVFRLKDLGNVRKTASGFEYAGNELTILRDHPVIVQWVPSGSPAYEVMSPDGSVAKGAIEPDYASSLGKVVQLERVGFVKLGQNRGYLTHK